MSIRSAPGITSSIIPTHRNSAATIHNGRLLAHFPASSPNWPRFNLPTPEYLASIAKARRENCLTSNMLEVIDPAAAPLIAAAGSVTSQSGEDGILAAL